MKGINVGRMAYRNGKPKGVRMELTRHTQHLPAKAEELHQFILVGKEKIKAHQAKIRAIDAVGLAETARKAALADAQDVATAVIYAEAKLGELLKGMPPRAPIGFAQGNRMSLPPGISKRISHQAQTIAANPAAVETEIAQAISNGEIPTPDKVYKLIKSESIKARNAELRERAASMPEGKYSVILADPPWQYSNSGFSQSAESHYPTMPTDDICKMSDQVETWSTPETVLFLWATNPLLPDALKVMEAWGFAYKTNIVWIKTRSVGIGWYLNSKHELLLIGVKINSPHPTIKPDSYFNAPHASHSRKPVETYDLIESMYSGPKLEMFCRTPMAGWAAHGNEI